eukprot:314358-Hanusia_phi.AAC.1
MGGTSTSQSILAVEEQFLGQSTGCIPSCIAGGEYLEGVRLLYFGHMMGGVITNRHTRGGQEGRRLKKGNLGVGWIKESSWNRTAGGVLWVWHMKWGPSIQWLMATEQQKL